jgi:hypothetical protein
MTLTKMKPGFYWAHETDHPTLGWSAVKVHKDRTTVFFPGSENDRHITDVVFGARIESPPLTTAMVSALPPPSMDEVLSAMNKLVEYTASYCPVDQLGEDLIVDARTLYMRAQKKQGERDGSKATD